MQRKDLPCDARLDVEAAFRASSDLRDLATDLLDSNTRSAGTPIIVRETDGIDLRLFVLQLAQQYAASAAVPIVISVADCLPRSIRCDKRHLRQALANGLSNACKLTYTGCVTIRVDWHKAAAPALPAPPYAPLGGELAPPLAPLGGEPAPPLAPLVGR